MTAAAEPEREGGFGWVQSEWLGPEVEVGAGSAASWKQRHKELDSAPTSGETDINTKNNFSPKLINQKYVP